MFSLERIDLGLQRCCLCNSFRFLGLCSSDLLPRDFVVASPEVVQLLDRLLEVGMLRKLSGYAWTNTSKLTFEMSFARSASTAAFAALRVSISAFNANTSAGSMRSY